MIDKRTQIVQALEKLIDRQRALDFQWLAFHLAKNRWPDLAATEWYHDGGEDGITIPSVGSDGVKRSLACSLSGTLRKVKQDCRRIAERSVRIDFLIFATPVVVTNNEVAQWKQSVQDEFSHNLVVIAHSAIIGDLERPENLWLCKEYLELDISEEPDIETLNSKVQEAASINLNGWKEEYGYDQQRLVELTLRLESKISNQETNLVSIHEICKSIQRARQVILTGIPGSGKTITLIQIAEHFLTDSNSPTPIIISLPSLATTSLDLFSFVANNISSQAENTTTNDLKKLNTLGRLVFLLNGWNEISYEAIERISNNLREIIRNSLATAFVITTRESEIAPPFIAAENLHIQPLNSHQRRAILRKIFSQELFSEIIQTIESRPALDQLTRIPLFLTGVIELTEQGKKIPESRYSILGELIKNAEKEHKVALRASQCDGNHRQYLSHIALLMIAKNMTNLDEKELTKAVANCSGQLIQEKLIGEIPNAKSVTETLINHHILVRSYSTDGSVRFIHQQFQEWFGAEWLFDYLASISEAKNQELVAKFQQEILNNTIWQESLFFLTERLREQENQHHYLVELIRWTMPLDLVFAAMLAGRSGPKVWQLIGEELGGTLRNWYALLDDSHKECALAGIFATGFPDFGDIIWPLFGKEDTQSRMNVHEASKYFQLSCLGEDWRSRFDTWPENLRREFIEDIKWDADATKLSIVGELAKTDPSPSVGFAALKILAWNGSFHTVEEVLQSELYSNWPTEIYLELLNWFPRKYLKKLSPRLKSVLATVNSTEIRLAILRNLDEIEDLDTITLMKKEIERDHSTIVRKQIIPRIFMKEPEWVIKWLKKKTNRVCLWEEEWSDDLSGLPQNLMERLSNEALAKNLDRNTSRKRLRALRRLNPRIAAKILIVKYLEISSQDFKDSQDKKNNRDSEWERNLYSTIRDLSWSNRVETVLTLKITPRSYRQLKMLLDLLTPESAFIENAEHESIPPEMARKLRAEILKWDKLGFTSLSDCGRLRARLAILLGSVGTPEDTEVLERWIQDEKERGMQEKKNWQKGYEKWKASKTPKGIYPTYTYVMHARDYSKAVALLNCREAEDLLISLLKDIEYIGYASYCLFQIFQENENIAPTRFGLSEYDKIFEKRKKRESNSKTSKTSSIRYAQAIGESITELLDGVEKSEGSVVFEHSLHDAALWCAQFGQEEWIAIILRMEKLFGCDVTNALEALMLQGVILPGNKIYEIVDPIISRYETKSWEDNWYIAKRGLAILLFSDAPELGVERIRRIPKERLRGYELRDLIQVLGWGKSKAAADYLVELSKDERLIKFFPELISALANNGQPECIETLLKIFDNSGRNQKSKDRRNSDYERSFVNAFVKLANENEEAWKEIQDLCANVERDDKRIILASTLERLGTEDAAIIACNLIRDSADLPIPYGVKHLIKKTMTNQIEADRPGSYYEEPKASNPIRNHLLDMALHDSIRRRSALALLASIEGERLRLGKPSDEPRHPNINLMSEITKPWPLL